VRGRVDENFKINEFLTSDQYTSAQVWPSLVGYDSTAPREGVKKVISYDVRKDAKYIAHFKSNYISG
jgi:hypothetical protein